MNDSFTYRCKQNDVVLTFWPVDDKLDEVWVGIEGVEEWIVVGVEELKEGLKQAEEHYG